MTIREAITKLGDIVSQGVVTEEYFKCVDFLEQQIELPKDRFPCIAWWSAIPYDARDIIEVDGQLYDTSVGEPILMESYELDQSGEFYCRSDQYCGDIGALKFRTTHAGKFVSVNYGAREKMFSDDTVMMEPFFWSLVEFMDRTLREQRTQRGGTNDGS